MRLHFACLLLLLIILSGCLQQTQLELENVNGLDHFGLTQGCYSTISGVVKNVGNSRAEEIEVKCLTLQEGTVFGQKSEIVDLMSAGGEMAFSLDVDTDCLKGDIAYECSVECRNCATAMPDVSENIFAIAVATVSLIAALAALAMFLRKKIASEKK